jgi:hypothetical protein
LLFQQLVYKNDVVLWVVLGYKKGILEMKRIIVLICFLFLFSPGGYLLGQLKQATSSEGGNLT